jgi:non-ribosomal peptide synthetase component F
MQLTEINTSQDKYPKEKALHQLFEDVVKRFPDAIAVVYENHHISYKTLNEHANQLAHYLREAGARPGVTVGVSLDHSIELIIGLLAILKAGGAYLPLDTSYPVERLCFMLEDAKSPILLTHSDFIKNFPTYTGVLFQFDKDWESLKNRSTENMDLTIFSKDLAYVFYTSGSTGKPKGVMSNHLSVMNRFIWAWMHYPFTEYDVCCTQTNIGFVDSLWDILGTLLHGIKLVVYPTNIAKDPERLMSLLQKHMITRIVMVPSFLRTFTTLGDHRGNIFGTIKERLSCSNAKCSLVGCIWRD